MRRMVALLFFLFTNFVDTPPFRVQVFPHLGDYSVPQGRERIVSKVIVTSEANCSQYITKLNQQNQWVVEGAPIRSSAQILLSNARLSRMARFFFHQGNAFYFKCSKPFKVNREKTLTSYTYEGDFVVIFDTSSRGKPVKIINIVDPEKYLMGVVPSEVSSSWPSETLKAQAVAARSYAWWQVLRARSNLNALFDLDDTIGYQAYLGITKRTPETDAAVMNTANMVMRYQGKVIKAYFSADSGGVTESSQNVFGENLPYLISQKESYDLSKTNTEWSKPLNLDDLSVALGKQVVKVEVQPQNRNESGRVEFLTVYAQDGSVENVAGTRVRKILKLRSTLFDVANQQIIGRGYGHGVGMAQIGAREYAKQFGWSFDQILNFYYHGITLERINESYSE